MIQRYRGHQNFVSNFVKASFGPEEKIIISGSEDGIMYIIKYNSYIWNTDNGNLEKRLNAHENVVYQSIWNSNQSLLASCSNDGTVKTWN